MNMLDVIERTTYLGPATVVCATSSRMQLKLPDREVWATSALACGYEPSAGDVVLAIGEASAWYVIGILRGSGLTSFNVPGDLAIRAPAGRITLTAAQGLELKSRQVRVTATRLELVAQSAVERFGDVTRWVKAAFQLNVGRYRARVDGAYDVRADRILERATRDVRIDGAKINLG